MYDIMVVLIICFWERSIHNSLSNDYVILITMNERIPEYPIFTQCYVILSTAYHRPLRITVSPKYKQYQKWTGIL